MSLNIKESKPRKTKTSEVLRYLKQYGFITSTHAISLFGATRLADIIYRLRRRGYDITTITQTKNDRYGNTCNFAKYILNDNGREEV